MTAEEMQRLFERHRDAEAVHDYDAILATFVEDCFLETQPLGLRSEGRTAARTAYEAYFTAFPDLASEGAEALVARALHAQIPGTIGHGQRMGQT